MALTVHQAIAVQRITHVLRGGHDLTDKGVRDSIARDIHLLERESHKTLGAGPVDPPERWSRRLADLEDGA